MLSNQQRVLGVVVVAGAVVWGLFLLLRREPTRLTASTVSNDSTIEESATTPTESLPPSPVPSQEQGPLAPSPLGSADAATPTASQSDEQLLRDLRAYVRSDPVQAEQLAREGRRRFPASPNADERDALLVDALINQERIGDARSETYYYIDHHPGGRFAEHLFVMTGVHPMPTGPGPN